VCAFLAHGLVAAELLLLLLLLPGVWQQSSLSTADNDCYTVHLAAAYLAASPCMHACATCPTLDHGNLLLLVADGGPC
jgi:hypothetical protein